MYRLIVLIATFCLISCGNVNNADYSDSSDSTDIEAISLEEGSNKAVSSSSKKKVSSSSSNKAVSSSSEKKVSSSSSNKAVSSSSEKKVSSSSSNTIVVSSSSELQFDDSEYPYAGIPRIVIETENLTAITDRETEIPAKLQIWEDSIPVSNVLELTIRGRGNTSWTSMPKKSYKIEFEKKQELLGMPKDKDWALISNYVDKSLIRNYIAYNLSRDFNAFYSPKCEFAELYINGEYLGVYLLTETLKIESNRIDMPKTSESHLIEIDSRYRSDEVYFFSDVIVNDGDGKAFRVHYPKSPTESELDSISQHVRDFEQKLLDISEEGNNGLDQWIDYQEFIKHYWVQEISKNIFSTLSTSVFFTWYSNEPIKMGPVWDFDLSFGVHANTERKKPEGWHINTGYWYKYLFTDPEYAEQSYDFWENNRDLVIKSINSIDSLTSALEKAASNNFKRWDILSDADYMPSSWVNGKSYNSYAEATADLKAWYEERINWIDSQISSQK